jgi:AAA family ATP:ADP antiporter
MSTASFGKIRSYIWPIYSFEIKKLLPMLLMLFCICFNYSVIRNLKDTLVVTAEHSGAEVIPFIKVWVMLPAAIITTILFTYLSNHFSRKKMFYIIISFFLGFFFLFTFFIYPNREALHPHAFANMLENILPAGCKGLVSMIRNWTLTCFYVLSELWGSIVLTVLFWSFANEITKISEATRFYSVLTIAGNVAAIIAGQVSVYFSQNFIYDPNMFFGHDAWEQNLAKIMSIIILSGIGVLFSFRWMSHHVLNDQKYLPENVKNGKNPNEKKLSFSESLRYIANSKYLLCIATLVISYNLVICLVEVIWKDQLRVVYPKPQDYNVYINNLTSIMGIISTTASILMAGIINKLGWTRTAILTPLILLITSIAFFICIIGGDYISPVVVLFGTTPAALAVLLGSVQNCFSKAAKYSLFDATKEMSFIPLDPEYKLKGKAAIDGIGSKLGKSGASCIHQGLLFIFATLTASAPYVALILIGVMVAWLYAVRSLGKQFNAYTQSETKGESPSNATPSMASF